MKIILDYKHTAIEADKIKIITENAVFRISLNRFGEVVINKDATGATETPITIKPSVSNEIRLS